MLSVIVYGRNDAHGYHYSKRFALSLNCIAEMLSHETDEILFVDYNTPNDWPTIAESLQDTLTKKTKSLLRVLRVRPSHIRSPLPVNEPLARNIALRRSNPKNKWLLSTNIDMIFVPHNPDKTLSDIVSELPKGFYQLPRFEMPEILWELSFNRQHPEETICFLREKAAALHLNTTIRRPGFLMYDNPGDFQLMLREDLFHIGGFNESMVKGWHVDSNLAKRMYLLHEKKTFSLEEELSAYHCNHNKKNSFFHSKNRAENSWDQFVRDVGTAFLPDQVHWGLKNEQIEEVVFDEKDHQIALKESLKACNKKSADILLNLFSYNTYIYSTSRIFPYLVDHLCMLPKNNCDVAYFGFNSALVSLLENYYEKRGLRGKIFRLKNRRVPKGVSVCIFDFGFDENLTKASLFPRKELQQIVRAFLKIVKHDHGKLKFIGINAHHSDFRFLFQKHLATISNSHVTGLTYGYTKTKSQKQQKKKFKKRALFNLMYLLTRYAPSQTGKLQKRILKNKFLRKVIHGKMRDF